MANVFDAVGDRVAQRVSAGAGATKTTSYLVDETAPYAVVVEERAPDVNDAGASQLQARYVCGNGLAPLAIWRKGSDGAVKLFFFVSDGQESVRQLTSVVGEVTDSYFYDAWGNALAGGSGTTENPFRYTGQQLDPDGKYFQRARFYDPTKGRFLGQDPLLGQIQLPASLHRYLYASADGANFSDPSGLTTVAEVSYTSSEIFTERVGETQTLEAIGGVANGGGLSVPFINPYYAYLAVGSVEALGKGITVDTMINARYRSEEEAEDEEEKQQQHYVYRALADNERIPVASGYGIQRGPGVVSLAEHISGRFRQQYSTWISTTRRFGSAVSFAMGNGRKQPWEYSPIIKIDLNKLSYPYFDVSTLEGFVGSINLKGGWGRVAPEDRFKTSVFAVFQREVSVEGGINPTAIVRYMTPLEWPAEFGWPQVD